LVASDYTQSLPVLFETKRRDKREQKEETIVTEIKREGEKHHAVRTELRKMRERA